MITYVPVLHPNPVLVSVARRIRGEASPLKEGDPWSHGQEFAQSQEEATQGHAPDSARRDRHVQQLACGLRSPAAARHGAGGHQTPGLLIVSIRFKPSPLVKENGCLVHVLHLDLKNWSVLILECSLVLIWTATIKYFWSRIF